MQTSYFQVRVNATVRDKKWEKESIAAMSAEKDTTINFTQSIVAMKRKGEEYIEMVKSGGHKSPQDGGASSYRCYRDNRTNSGFGLESNRWDSGHGYDTVTPNIFSGTTRSNRRIKPTKRLF